ncbi:MAG TPA: hypothetical protein ENJ95_02685 [Bacteroidetes bacterium]|nr:hypothetical protein [Bacteroidota bacterium]
MLKLILKNSWAIALFAMIAFASCNQESDVVADETTTDVFVDQALFTMQQEGSIGRFGCYELVFPIGVEFPDGTAAVAEDYEELATAIKDWKMANPGPGQRPSFVFPIAVVSGDGEVVSVENQESLRQLRMECGDGRFDHHGPRDHRRHMTPCFKIVFPITIEFPDGTTAEAGSRMELKQLVRQWRMDNPGVDGRPAIVFPINIELEDGTVQQVDSKEELREIRQACGGHPAPCFQLVFPVTVEFPDGTTAEAANKMELKQLLREWRMNHPGPGEKPALVFPIEVETEDGAIITVDSKEALRELRQGCN